VFNIGPGELIVVALVVLIAVGPEQLPGMIRKVGQTVAQLRSMTEGLRTEFMAGLEEIERAADVQTWADDPADDPEPKTRSQWAGDPEPAAAVVADREETPPDPATEFEADPATELEADPATELRSDPATELEADPATELRSELETEPEPEASSTLAERLDRGPRPSSNGTNGDGGADMGLPREEPPTAEERA
jgi:sec-independent protein translocase protein TatB